MHVVRYPWKLWLNLVIFAGFGQTCPGMSKVLQNNKATISLGRIELVTHPWKLQCYHGVLVGYGPACPKFSEITRCQYFGKG